jgi:hypothetical protein
MRILGFSKRWGKLQHDTFTTFRVPRKDAIKGRDWHEGEVVGIYYHNRCPDREYLGDAQIVRNETTWFSDITNHEAIEDGFPDGISGMYAFMRKSHGYIGDDILLNKLTLKWLERSSKQPLTIPEVCHDDEVHKDIKTQ